MSQSVIRSAKDTGEPISAPHFEVVMLMLSYWGAASCVIAFESARQETDFTGSVEVETSKPWQNLLEVHRHICIHLGICFY